MLKKKKVEISYLEFRWLQMSLIFLTFLFKKNLLVKHLNLYTVAFYYRAASFTRDVIWNWGYEPQAHFIRFQKRQLNADRLFEIRSTLIEIRSTLRMNVYNLQGTFIIILNDFVPLKNLRSFILES